MAAFVPAALQVAVVHPAAAHGDGFVAVLGTPVGPRDVPAGIVASAHFMVSANDGGNQLDISTLLG